MRAGLTITVLVALLAASAAGAFRIWQELGDVEISRQGWLALGLGAGTTFLVGAGLMSLVFFSSRRGFDERVNCPDEDHRDER